MKHLPSAQCRCVALLTVSLTVLATSAQAVDTTWTFDGDGFWDDATKWDNDEPVDDTFDVFIDDGDTAVNVTLSTTRSINSLMLGADDTLTIHSEDALVALTSANSFTNDGSIVLTGAGSTYAWLDMPTATLTNSATGLLHFQDGGSGFRYFTGDLVNDGTAVVDWATAFDKAGGVYVNNGQFTIGASGIVQLASGATFEHAAGMFDVSGGLDASAAGSVLNLTGGVVKMNGGTLGGTVTQTGGTLEVLGFGQVFGGTYNYLGGTITGTLGLVNTTLNIGPSATEPAEFSIGGFSSLELANDTFAAGHKFTVVPQFGIFPTAGFISAEGFTNEGTIVLSGTFGPGLPFNIGQSTISDGTLVNGPTGLIDFDLVGGPNNQQTIDGHFTNLGTVLVRGGGAAGFLKTGGGGVFTNNGQFTVSSSFGFSIDSGTFTQADGALDVMSQLYVYAGSALDLTGGEMNLTGELHIDATSDVNLLSNGVLNMTGNGIVYNGGTFTQDGGTLNYSSVWYIYGGHYRFLGGAINGTPVLTGNASLEIGPAATDPVSFLLTSDSEFLGEVHAGQVLTVQSQFAENASLTAAEGFTNNGEIRLTSTGSGVTTLSVTTGALTNGATGVLHFQTGGTSNRTFSGDLVNHGTVLVDRTTTFNKTGGSYTNNGLFTSNQFFRVSGGGTFDQAGGTLDARSTLSLIESSALNLTGGEFDVNFAIESSDGGNVNLLAGGVMNLAGSFRLGTFTQDGGTLNYTSGTIDSLTYRYLGGTITGVPLLSDLTLEIGPTATDPASFLMTRSNTLVGDVHAGQEITVRATGETCCVFIPASLTSDSGFTNNGSIILTANNNGITTLAIADGALLNSATGFLHFGTGNGGRVFTGDLVNQGAVQVSRTTTFNKSGGMYTNLGLFTISASQTLTISNGTLTNLATNVLTGGTYDVSGTFRFPDADIVTNQAGIILRGASSQILNDTGGANALTNLAAIGSAGAFRLFSGRNFTAVVDFTNQGELELGGTTFTAPSLDNSGIVTASGSGMATLAAATHTNTGTYEALDASTFNATGVLTNVSASTLAGGTYRVVDSGGGAAMTIAGSAVTTIATGTTVELSGAGAAMSFGGAALADSLSQNGGTLKILDGHHFSMANAFLNTGTITLGDQAGDETALTTGQLTNEGTLAGHGTIYGHVMNTIGALAPGSSTGTFHIDGDYTQGASGQLMVELASTTSFDRLLVNDAAMLDGLLNVSLLGGFAPAQDDAFVILTAASLTGTFVNPMLAELTGDFAWKILYEPTSVSLISYLPGDFNRDGTTDAADFVVWRKSLGQTMAPGSGADGDFDGQITPADYDVWRAHFGQTAFGGAGALAASTQATVPEPSTILLFCLAILFWSCRRTMAAASGPRL